MILKDSNIESIVIGSKNSKQFSVSDNKIIFDVLRNKLYTDPVGSICREIASNSRDANRESGRKNEPIEIKILESVDQLGLVGDLAISFKDHGPGIDPDRMNDVFLIYGESTKTKTNTQTGGFGLGAKTPFAYSDTFSISTVCEKNGVRTKYFYVAAIDKEEKGTMHLFRVVETKDETGTEITVPIRREDRSNFESKCVFYTKYWDVVPRFVNFSRYTDTLAPDKRKILKFDGFEIRLYSNISGHHSGGVKILVDGIPYDSIVSAPPTDMITLPFPNGLFDLGAGREYIQKKKENEAIIIERFKKLTSFAETWLTDYIKKLPTYSKAIIAWKMMRDRSRTSTGDFSNDDECLAEVFYTVAQWAGKGSELSTWNGRNLTEENFKFIKLYEHDRSSFSYMSRKKHYKTSSRNFVDAFIRTSKLNPHPTAHLIDTDEKLNQRVWTLVKPDEPPVSIVNGAHHIAQTSSKRVLMYSLITKIEYVKDDASEFGIFDWKESQNVDAQYIEDKMTDTNFKEAYDLHLKDYDTVVAKELKMLEELFLLEKMSDVVPTKYAVNNPHKKDSSEPVCLRYRMYDMNDDGELSYLSHNTKLSKKQQEKKSFDKHIIFKANSLGKWNNDRVDLELMKFIMVIKTAIFGKEYEICASSVNYNNMVAHGAIPVQDFLKSITEDQWPMVKSVMSWQYVDEIILKLSCCNELSLEPSDVELLESFNLKKSLGLKFWGSTAGKLVKAISTFSRKLSLISDTYYKEVFDTIGPANHAKMILSKDEIENVKRIERKYPLLSVVDFDPLIEDHKIKILNSYFELVNSQQPRKSSVTKEEKNKEQLIMQI